ncbi:MAG: hypothetical protein N3E37_03330 [Candidatus Micrarchaeota archaeon]|nr:hypothetical protein [Candidatus Micrarchaeota archaeon]
MSKKLNNRVNARIVRMNSLRVNNKRYFRGYIFTLDAFVALLLVVFSILILYSAFQIGEDNAPYMLQSYLMAYDTAIWLMHHNCSYVDSGLVINKQCAVQIFAGNLDKPDIQKNVTGLMNRTIPYKYHAILTNVSSIGEGTHVLFNRTLHYNNSKEFKHMASYDLQQYIPIYPARDDLMYSQYVCVSPPTLDGYNFAVIYDPSKKIRIKVYV